MLVWFEERFAKKLLEFRILARFFKIDAILRTHKSDESMMVTFFMRWDSKRQDEAKLQNAQAPGLGVLQ